MLKEQGRFSSNVLLSYDERNKEIICKGFPYTVSGEGDKRLKRRNSLFFKENEYKGTTRFYQKNEGSAARYFYNINTSKDTHNCSISLFRYLIKLVTPNNSIIFNPFPNKEIRSAIELENNENSKNWKFVEVKEDV